VTTSRRDFRGRHHVRSLQFSLELLDVFPVTSVAEPGAIKQALESIEIEVGNMNFTVRHNSLLADATAVRAAVLTRAPHPAPILGARLQKQKRDPTENGGGDHDPGDGYEVHLFYSPIGVGETRLVLPMTLICDHSNPSRGRRATPESLAGATTYPSTACRRQLGRRASERKLSAAGHISRASCQPPVSRPQWSHCNQRRADDRATRSS
jgi:hypothetical protein